MTLEVADGFSLPDDYATQRGCILAISGAGKSNVAVVLAEEMHRAGIPWFVIDPKGDWWGMQSSGDGTSEGIPVPIFGGEHGNIPLTPDAGPMVARLIATRRLSCILDLSGEEFTVRADMFRFLEAFATTLLRTNKTAVHGFLEEADDYLPVSTRGDGGPAARALGAMQRLVKQGRNKGIGTTQISQRSAALNINTRSMAETYIVLRAQGARDIVAVREWIAGPVALRDISDEDKALLESLDTLGNGEAWIVSPHALKVRQRVQFRRRWTFDSGRTPELGEILEPPSTLADIDVEALGAEVVSLRAQVLEDDPERLHAIEAELREHVVTLTAERDELSTEVEALGVTTQELRDEVVAAVANHDELSRDLQRSRLECDRLRGEYETLEGELESVRAHADNLFGDAERAHAEITRVTAALDEERAKAPGVLHVPTVPDGLQEAAVALRGALDEMDTLVNSLTGPAGEMRRALAAYDTAKAEADAFDINTALEALKPVDGGPGPTVPDIPARPVPVPPRPPSRTSAPPRPTPPPSASPPANGARVPGAAGRKVLAELAQHPEGRSRRQLAAGAGVSSRKSTLRNTLSTLRVGGYISEADDGTVFATDAGLAVLGADAPLPLTREERLDHWRAKVGQDGAARRLLEVLIVAYPERVARDGLAERIDVDPETTTTRNAISKLRSHGLLDESDKRSVALSSALFT